MILQIVIDLPVCPYVLYILGEPYDWTLCKRLALEHGVCNISYYSHWLLCPNLYFSSLGMLNVKVVGVPASPFYSSAAYLQEPGAAPLARFAFCKQDSTLLEACRRLRIKSYIP